MGTTAPFQEVLHDPHSYRFRTPLYKIVKKFLHKFLYLQWQRQVPLLVDHIPVTSRTLLLYTGKDSFGDANLELSGRALLKHRGGHSIDLLTIPKLEAEFGEDDIFQNVYTKLADCIDNNYTHILLAEFNHKSLRLKCEAFKDLPLATLFGYFDGPARNQATFSYAAFNRIYKLGYSPEQIIENAKPYLATNSHTRDSIISLIPSRPFAALSLGGIDPTRTYQQWAQVLHLLDKLLPPAPAFAVVLIGSDNGLSFARTIINHQYRNLEICNLVGKLSLLQTREVVVGAKLFVGCDGGLMHAAHSTATPSVTLFNHTEPNPYWLTPACHSTPLQSDTQVTAISPETVANAVFSALVYPHKP